MALYHFSTKQIKRSAGKSVVSSAAYISGRKLYSEYYDEYTDYRRKGGVVYHEIMLPDNAPRKYADQETLWNAVEFTEKNKRAQLAYAFNITLQNELTAEENHALAVRFIQEQFISRGLIADFAIHDPDREDNEPNPHFHVLCPIRPLNPDGSWGAKQHREYALDENGERIRDEKGRYVFNAVPTTDWGRPETLETWRKAWCDLCNEAFEKKGLAVRIDHRSYLRQGIDLIPTEHEGPLVRHMESRGIPTEKGEKNRWIKATNALIRDITGKMKSILQWIADTKAILNEKPERRLADYVSTYQSMRMAGAYTQKAKVKNTKEFAQIINFMSAHNLYTLEDIEACSERLDAEMDAHMATMKACDARKKELKERLSLADDFTQNARILTKLGTIHFKGAREKFMKEHETEIRLYRMAKRKLSACCDVETPLPLAEWQREIAMLESKSQKSQVVCRQLRDAAYMLWKIKYRVQKVWDMEEQIRNKRNIVHSHESER